MMLVTFALPAESCAFIRELTNVKREGATVRGEIPCRTTPTGEEKNGNGKDRTSKVVVLHTGVGPCAAAERLSSFLEKERPRVLISSGFCGATSDAFAPGDLIMGDSSAAELARVAQDLLGEVRPGRIFSATEVIDVAAARYAIGRDHGATAIDMETETITRICRGRSLPMLSLRIVSDTPSAPFPAPPRVLFDISAQRTKFLVLLGYLARHPAAIPRLLRFAKQVRVARARLAAGLRIVLAGL